jgi:hypothetical protein
MILVVMLLATSASPQVFAQADQSENRLPILSFSVERLVHSGYVDRGSPGLSPGDLYTWGPNPLFDAENIVDTGASVRGACVVLDASGLCLANEVSSFVLGGQLHAQGLISGGDSVSTLTIIGGTRNFLNATGTIEMQQLPDGAAWIRVYEVWVPGV